MEHHDRSVCFKGNEHEDTKFGNFDHKFYVCFIALHRQLSPTGDSALFLKYYFKVTLHNKNSDNNIAITISQELFRSFIAVFSATCYNKHTHEVRNNYKM
jgi:hypothetical protein